MVITFTEETHEYELNGTVIPSVSELTRFMSREIYGDVDKSVLERAAERGTAVHEACEGIDRTGEAEADDEALPYATAYVQFRREHKAAWDGIEQIMYHREHLYAGRLDRIGTVDGKRCIVDIKTSSTLQKPLYTAQLNLYRLMAEQDGRKVDRLLILHLTKEGKYKLVELPISDDLPLACLALDKALRKKKRGKK